ncbi:hypothetical protein LCGC14_0476030 [marine sediment metagenome]|uniref:Uncharacterized protein n=1 Tax=marine sediment metagenome TaxID=412755 RepID=A0A0F9UXR5_9ZZZZ
MSTETDQKPNPKIETKPNELPKIPAGYADLGAVAGYNPPPPEKLNMLVVGPSNEGKSTFINSTPRTMVLDFEKGSDSIIDPKAIRIPIRDIAHYDKILAKLIADAKTGNRPFDRVAIDTGDEAAGMLSLWIANEKDIEDIAEYGREGHGWFLLRNRFMHRLRELNNAGYAWTIAGHIVEEKITDRKGKERLRIKPALFPSLYKSVLRLASFEMTFYRLAKSQQRMKTIKHPTSGANIEVPDGDNVDVVETYYLDMRALDGEPGKKRGVPNMAGRFELPLVDGWQVFKDNYNRAVNELKGESV